MESEFQSSSPPLLWLAYYVRDRGQAVAISLPFGILVAVSGAVPPMAVSAARDELALQVADYLKTAEPSADVLRPASVEACLEHFFAFLEAAVSSPRKRTEEWDYGTTPLAA